MEKHISLLILVFLVKFSISIAASNETDQKALLAFQNLISPSHFLAINWTKNTSYCSWFGVTYSPKRQRVVALALPNLQLQGTILPCLANLSFLRVLNIGNNSFHGGIPYGLGHLPRLRVIDIQNNQLNGSIPTSLFQHRRVQVISLAFNKLHGEMWKGPWYVPELRVLDLTNNSLTGVIPPSVGNATNMINFSLFGNRVNGNIPKEIGNLSQLADLSLSDNQLTGSIPAILFNISSLLAIHLRNNSLSSPLLLDEGNIVSNREPEVLYIGRNAISGTIPASLGNISTLQNLDCSHSRIVGQVPQELGKLSNLRLLNFEHNYNLIGQIQEAIFNISSLETIAFNSNNLSGRIPSTTGLHLPNLKGLYLGDNHFEGEIPLFIINASKLEILGLAQNFLTGAIPTNLGNLRELRSLLLYHNQLTNEPRDHELRFFNSLADCRMLRYLQVGYNLLNGVLPNSIGNFSSTIQNIEIGDTHINGLIPTNIGNIRGLMALGLVGNNLIGSIPSDVGGLKQFQGLYLHNNKLQGHIAEEVCHLSNLVELTLDDNELSGLISECIGYLSMLQVISLSSNTLSSTFPSSLWKMSGLLIVDVSQNSIEGEVPSDIGGLKTIVELDLSCNHFSGMIPSQLGDLQNLKSLDLSNNSFLDSIPLSFAKLISLEYLDLSLNALSEGEIPNDGVFVNSTLQSFLGNRGLCGMHILEVPTCPINNPGKQLKSKELMLKIVTPVVISSFMILLLISIWIMKRKKIGKSKDVEKVLEIRTYQLISYHEIQRATNNFDESNLIAVSKSMAHTETLGSLGYIAPEYGLEGIGSTSGDVYSYGIMLMEVLTKRRPTDEEICNENLDLRKWITQSFSGTLMDVVDANLFSEEEQITSKSEICIGSMIELALDCTKEMPESRITMKDVVKRLNKIKNEFLEM
ncbi:hypothetical protein KY284_020284 [Solanum tuberosum]|nr:hypothetical protein KY284_020284 [Solanum tuberosum]